MALVMWQSQNVEEMVRVKEGAGKLYDQVMKAIENQEERLVLTTSGANETFALLTRLADRFKQLQHTVYILVPQEDYADQKRERIYMYMSLGHRVWQTGDKMHGAVILVHDARRVQRDLLVAARLTASIVIET